VNNVTSIYIEPRSKAVPSDSPFLGYSFSMREIEKDLKKFDTTSDERPQIGIDSNETKRKV
jgi:hypothetical protein